MDPISILELVGGVLRTTGEVSKLIYLFIHEAKRVDDTLTGFADEINGLKRVLLAISTTLNDPQLRLAEISPGQYGNKDMWEAIHGSLADCHTYLEKLSTELANISRKKGQGGLFRQAWRTFELRLSKDDIAGIRSHVHSHHISLNTMLQMLSVYVTCRLPMQMQSGLAVQIDTLGGMLSKMQAMIDQQPSTPQALVPPEEIVVEQFWNDEQGSRKKLKEVGEKVRSNASLISAARSTVWGGSERNSVYSTTGSELGEQLSYAAQHNIETWLTQPKLAAITESDSSSEGSTSAPNESIFSKQSGSAPTTNTKISEIEELDSDGEGRLEFEILQKLLAKGKRLYDNGKYPEAETTLRRSLKRSTSLSPSLRSLLDLKSPKLLLARSCFSQQKFDEAQSLLVGLTQELAIDDSHAALILDASFSLSEVFLHKQDFGNAEIYCKRTIVGRGRVNGKIHESYHDAIRLLTRIYISKGDEDEADAWSEMLPKTIPEVTVDMTGTEDETDLSNEGSMANLSSQIPSRPYLAKGISSPSLNTGEFLTRPTTPGRKRFPINISGTSRLENSSLENLDVANHHRTCTSCATSGYD